jgi:quercetin dioxygenase-like cupin family protein
MITRREAVAAVPFLLQLAATADLRGQTAPGGPTTIYTHDLPNLTMDGWEVTVSYVDYPPGRVGSAHRHPGFVLAYVLQGAVVTKISGQEEQTYTAGQMFFEAPGSVHEVSNNASRTEPARLLAMVFAKKGLPLTVPA